jgi:hypothetical protein
VAHLRIAINSVSLAQFHQSLTAPSIVQYHQAYTPLLHPDQLPIRMNWPPGKSYVHINHESSLDHGELNPSKLGDVKSIGCLTTSVMTTERSCCAAQICIVRRRPSNRMAGEEAMHMKSVGDAKPNI